MCIQQGGSPASLDRDNACALTQAHTADPVLTWTYGGRQWSPLWHDACTGLNATLHCSQSDCRDQEDWNLGGLVRHDSTTSLHATHAMSLTCWQKDCDSPLETMKRARSGSGWVCCGTLERRQTRTSGGWSSPIPQALPAEVCTCYTSVSPYDRPCALHRLLGQSFTCASRLCCSRGKHCSACI